MLEFGIIGAENSHCAAIAKLCNVNKQVDARVTYVWGETEEFAKKAAEAGQIPNIVTDWKQMLGKVQGVMMDHRHAKPHFEVAKFFISKGIPCFVDKPFTFTLKEAKALSSLARRKKVPITSFSVIPQQKSFQEAIAKVRATGKLSHFITTGPAQINSPYGGIFFYGIHQVDAIIDLLGANSIKSVQATTDGKTGCAVLTGKDGVFATMNFIDNGYHAFHFAAVTDKGYVAWDHKADENPYLTGAQTFIDMFKSGKEPLEHARFVYTIAVLEALAKSIKTGKSVKVAKV